MRAALDDLAWNLHIAGSGVEAIDLTAAAWILRNAASLGGIGLMLWRIPVGRPFPDVADHVVQPVAVWRECTDRRGALEAIGIGILARELSLPGVGHVTAVRRQLVAPCELGAVEAAARRKLPFGFGREFLAGHRA